MGLLLSPARSIADSLSPTGPDQSLPVGVSKDDQDLSNEIAKIREKLRNERRYKFPADALSPDELKECGITIVGTDNVQLLLRPGIFDIPPFSDMKRNKGAKGLLSSYSTQKEFLQTP